MSEQKVKKLVEQKNREAEPKKTPKRPRASTKYLKLSVALFVVVLVLIAGGLAIYHFTTNKTVRPNPVVSSMTGDNFSVSWPSTPTISTATDSIYGKPSPYKSYIAGTTTNLFVVRKYDLSASVSFKYYDASEKAAFLKNWIKNIASAANSKWTYVSSQAITVAGKQALVSTLTAANPDGTTSYVYFYNFINGETMYNIFTQGVTQTNSSNFINSFKLT